MNSMWLFLSILDFSILLSSLFYFSFFRLKEFQSIHFFRVKKFENFFYLLYLFFYSSIGLFNILLNKFNNKKMEVKGFLSHKLIAGKIKYRIHRYEKKIFDT